MNPKIIHKKILKRISRGPLFALIFLLFVSCSVHSIKNYRGLSSADEVRSRADEAMKELDGSYKGAIIAEGKSWHTDDPDFIYAEACRVMTNDKNFSEVKEELKLKVLKELSERMQVTIESVFLASKQESMEEGFSEYARGIIRTYSNATFVHDELEFSISPASKPKDKENICLSARLNEKRYTERLQREKIANELRALDEFLGAKSSFDDGNMAVCITRLIKCKYYVEKGGGGKIVEYYKDSMQAPQSISSQLDEITEDVKKHLSFKVEDHEDLSKITFQGKTDRLLKVRIYSQLNPEIEYRGIDFELVALEDSSTIKSRSSVDNSGYILFDLSRAPLGIEKVEFLLRPSINPSIVSDEEWMQSHSYRNYLSKLDVTRLSVFYDPFPRNNLLSVVTFGEGVRLWKIGENKLYSELQSLLANDTEFFNLLARGAGPPESELKALLRADSRMSKNQELQLSVCDLILRLAIESAPSADIVGGGQLKYDISLSLLAVKKGAFIVLGTTSHETPLTENELISGISNLHERFMDEYFFQTIEIITDRNLKHEYLVNGNHREIQTNQKSFRIKDLSRYHPIRIDVVDPAYRKKSIMVPPSEFAYYSTNRKYDQSDDIKSFDISLTPKSGSLRIITRDNDTGEILSQQMQYSPHSQIWQTRFLFFPKNKFESDSNNVVFHNLPPGQYTIMATQDGYTRSLPSFKTIYDDLEFSEEQRITIRLSRKSLLLATGLSTLYPGVGHWYMDKPLMQYSIPAVIYSGAILFSWNRYSAYQNFRSEFESKQALYFSQVDPNLTESYKIEAQLAHDDMNIAKTQVYLGVGSAIATNLLTNAILVIQKKLGK